MEKGSHNTWENFHNSCLIVEAMSGRVGILTSDDHSGRVAAVCRKLGWSPVLVPVPDAHKRWNVWEQHDRPDLDGLDATVSLGGTAHPDQDGL